METCKICGESFKNLKALTTHVKAKHFLNGKEYYDKHLKKEGEGQCVVCSNETTYRNVGVGYLENCSVECRNKNKNIKRDYWKGKTQSKDTIAKRVQNTDQIKKEGNRKETMLDKYGVDNPSKLDIVKSKISIGNKGKIVDRDKEWQDKIIDSKRKNGTLKHSDETKAKIGTSLNKYHSLNFDREKYISTSNNVKHLSGWYNGLYFRSSLELSFLINNNHIKFISCETKKFGLTYQINDKIKTYFPDYTDGQLIYEIKPTTLLQFGSNPLKIEKGKEIFGQKFRVITEKDSPYVPKQVIIGLIEGGSVVLTKNSEHIFKKYRH